MEKKVDVVIVGAGLGGLYLARELKKEGVSLAIVEKSGLVGGVISQTEYRGYIVPKGPRIFLRSRASQLLKLADECKLRYVLSDKSMPRYLVKDTLELQKVTAKLALNYPRLVPGLFFGKRSSLEETIAGFFSKNVGQRFVSEVLEPLCQGIWASDPSELSLDVLMPAIKNKQFFKKNRVKGMVFFPQGLGFLTQEMARFLEDSLYLNTECTGFEKNHDGLLVHTSQGSIKAQSLVLAGSFHQTAAFLKTHSAGGFLINDLDHSSSIDTVTFCFQKKLQRPQGSGYLIPSRLGLKTKGVLFDADLMGYGDIDMLSCFIKDSTSPIQDAHLELKKILKSVPEFETAFHTSYEHSIFKCQLGAYQAIELCAKNLEKDQLYLLGAYPKVGVADVLEKAVELKGRLISQLKLRKDAVIDTQYLLKY